MRTKLAAWLFTAILVALTAWLAATAAKAPQVTDQMAFLPETPEVRRFVEINERYGNFNTVLVGIEAKDILAPATLGTLRDLTNAIGKVAGISWMSSLATVPYMKPSDEGVVVEPHVPETLPTDKAGIEALRTQIRGDRTVMGQLINHDFTAALIVVTPYGDQVATVVPRIEELALAAAGPDFKVVFHGAPAVDSFLAKAAEAIPPYGVAAGVLFLVALLTGLRPRRIPAWLLVVAPAAAAGMAAPGLFGFASSQLSMAAGLAAFVFGSLVVFSYPGAADAARWRRWWLALLIVALGLAAVFARLAASPVLPLQGLGVGFAAAVLVVALVGPMALVAGMTLVGGEASAAATPSTTPGWGWLAALAPVALAAGLVATSPAPSAENDLTATFGAEAEPARAVHFLDTRFGGADFVTLVLNGDFAHPAFLRAADDLAADLRAVPGVADIVSPTDIFKMINQAMIGHYRIPDTVEQMQALWFFLEGQPELSALLYKREQGLMQVRLTPEGSAKKVRVLDEMQRAIARVPGRVGLVDLRTVADADAARLRTVQVERAVKLLAARLGEPSTAPLAATLGAIAPLELRAASKTPDARLQAAWRERLDLGLLASVGAWLTDPNGPITLTPEQLPVLLQTLVSDAGGPDERGRAGLERLLKGWFPGDDEVMAKVAGAILDKARDVQDKTLKALLQEELTAAKLEAPLDADALGRLRDVGSPYAVVDASAETAKLMTDTGASFELSGYPAITRVLAEVTFHDLLRLAYMALAVLALLTGLALVLRGPGAVARARLVLLVALGAIAWQVLWLKGHAWALDVSSFLGVGVALVAAGGAGLLVLTARSGREHLAAALLTAGPLLVMALCPFVPVKTVMGLSGIGIAGAALSAWLAGPIGPGTSTNAKEDAR